MIQVHHVGKLYGTVEAIRDVSFEIGTGEIVGLLGPNGAGKTTLLRILTCYHLPSSGSARINSHDIVDESIEVRRSIGYLPENAPIYPELTPAEYLEFVAAARGVRRSERSRRIRNAAEQCGVSEVLGQSIGTLSKGYRQRVGLAQAILHSPPILVLDEPTNGLDPNQIVEVRGLLASLGREKTVILSTHILGEVEAICGRMLILHRGRIVAEGSAEAIRSASAGGARFRVVLRAGRTSVKRAVVERIPGVSAIASFAAADDGTVSVELVASDRSRFGERLFDAAVANGFKVLSVSEEERSLEEIFGRLTREEST